MNKAEFASDLMNLGLKREDRRSQAGKIILEEGDTTKDIKTRQLPSLGCSGRASLCGGDLNHRGTDW